MDVEGILALQARRVTSIPGEGWRTYLRIFRSGKLSIVMYYSSAGDKFHVTDCMNGKSFLYRMATAEKYKCLDSEDEANEYFDSLVRDIRASQNGS